MAWLDRSYLDHSPMDDVMRVSHTETAEVGLTGSLVRSAAVFGRTLTASIGATGVLTSVDSVGRTLTAAVGLSATIEHSIHFSRSLSAAVGLEGTIARSQNHVRSIVASAIGLAGSLLQRRRAARNFGYVGTDRNRSVTGTDRSNTQVGEDRDTEVY